MNLFADISTLRLVNPNNLLVGLRQIELTEGVHYSGSLNVVSGSHPLSGQITNFQLTVAETRENSVPVLSSSGASGASYEFIASSIALDYSLRNSTRKTFKTDVKFDFSGVTYALASVLTPINNDPSISAGTGGAWYPLHENPANYVRSGETGQFATVAALAATGARFTTLESQTGTYAQSSALVAYIPRSESGQFSPVGHTHDTRYVLRTESGTGQSFNFDLPSGVEAAFVPFPQAFTSAPVVTYAMNLPEDGGLFAVGTSGTPSTTGFYVLFSAPIDLPGYSLSVFAR